MQSATLCSPGREKKHTKRKVFFYFHADVSGRPDMKLVGQNNDDTLPIMSSTSPLEAASNDGYKSGTYGLRTEPIYMRTDTAHAACLNLSWCFPLLSPGAFILMYLFTGLVHITCKYL